jgi:hypothetical protein
MSHGGHTVCVPEYYIPLQISLAEVGHIKSCIAQHRCVLVAFDLHLSLLRGIILRKTITRQGKGETALMFN